MKDLVELIIKSLVDNVEAIQIKEIPGEKTVIFEVKIAEEDVGKVIGKHGKTINAIRTILKAATTKDNKKVILEVIQ